MNLFYLFSKLKRSLVVIILIMLVCVVSADAQKVTLSVTDGTIREVIERLQKQYGYSFSIRTGDVDLQKKISVSVADTDIEALLAEVFRGQPVAFTVDGKIISVTEAPRGPAAPADRPARADITGFVLDQDGAPVVGAAVVVKGTTLGTSTGADGSFRLAGAPPRATLQVTYLGMKPVEATVAEGQGSVRVVMEPEVGIIDDVVVVGYGTQRRSMVANAISQFKPDENNMRSALSPAELLQGRVAGVSVSTTSGNLGTGERISIRGSSSLSASNEPLYVVDGIPLNNESGSLYSFGEDLSSLAVLNLTDIESIEILKDAASAAIYGSRATNGVILITTKQGREGRSEVKANYSVGVSQFPNRNRIRYADSRSWVEVYNDGIDNYNRQHGYLPSHAGYVTHIRNPYEGLPDTDWLDVITRLGIAHNADLSFSSGTEKTKLYIGGSYGYQEGVVKTNDITKINLKANISHRITPWLEVGANMSGNYLKNNRVPGASLGSTIVARAVEQRPFDRPFKPNGEYYVGGTDELSRHNPVQILREQTSYVDNYRFLGAFYAEATLTENLRVRGSFNTDAGYTLDYLYYNENHPYKEDNGRIIEKTRFMISNVSEVFATYDNRWGDVSLSAMAGHSYQKTTARSNSIDAQNFPSPSFDMVGVAANIAGVTGGLGEYAMQSVFGRVSLSYLDRYILNATLRADGSSRFAPDCRWGYFPSVSVGWNLSRERFWTRSSVDLKLRASYGKTGNQDGIGNYGWQPLINGGSNYGGQSGIAVGSKGNARLTWETADQFDAGFDLGLMNGRINMMVDGYLKNTRNLLYQMPVPATSGQTSMLSNIGSMRNYGIEFTVNVHSDLGPVQWTSSLNISHNRNKLTKLLGDDITAIGSNHALQVGKSLGAFYLLRFDGIYQYDGEVPDAQYKANIRAGDVRYYDRDGNGIINDSDRIVVGSPNPDFSGGWNNTFRYKGLSLNVFLTYSYGNDVYAQWMTGPTRMGNYQALLQQWADNRWTGPGSTDRYPRAIYSYHGNNAQQSTYYLKDGSFIKLKSVMVSYMLPTRWVEKLHMKSVRVFVQGENLALLSKYPGWDPEISTSLDPAYIGIDNYGVPAPRIFKAGINVSF